MRPGALPARAVALALGILSVWAVPGEAQTAQPDSVVVLSAPPGAMAEATITADPADPRRLAAAADPYLDPVRIVVTQSDDGGATWGPPVTVVPPGFAKSYDPALGFDMAGNLLVVGGASGEGAPHCQPGSAIFAATVRGGGVDYGLVRDGRPDGAYVDRPELAVTTSGTTSAFATWTESTGPSAECRATPARSTMMIARLGPRGSVIDAHPLPPAGQAPYGAAISVGDDGILSVAVGDHGGGRTRLVYLSSSDAGATWSAPTVVDDGPDPALTVAGIGGVLAPVPSLATTDGRIALAWNKGAAPGPEVAVFELAQGGQWASLGSPAPSGSVEVLPSVAYDGNGRLWLLAGRASRATLDYESYRWNGSWDASVTLGGGPAGGLSELGEALGLVYAGGQVIAAFPVDDPSGSSLTVARLAAPVAPKAPAPSPTTVPDPAPRPRPAASRTGLGAAPVITVVVMLVLIVAAAGAYGRRRRPSRS